MLLRPPPSPLFPYTTLFRSRVPREEVQALARGLTPARLAEVVGHLSSLEIAFAYAKMRQRSTPGNQAHVTNAKDDPLQLAADARSEEHTSELQSRENLVCRL